MSDLKTNLLRTPGLVWGAARDRVGKWLVDRYKHRLLVLSVAVMLVAVAVGGVLTVTLRPAAARLPEDKQTLTLPFAPNALLAADGSLYAGSADGALVSFDAVRDSRQGRVELPEPIDYMVAHGDHIYAGGEETLTRLDPGLGQPLSRPIAVGGHTTLRALAAGPLGLWGLLAPGNLLVHISGQSLHVVQQFALPGEAGALAIGYRAVWIVPDNATDVLLAQDTPRGWKVSSSQLNCHPSAVFAEHDRAYVLCPEAQRVIVLTDLGGRELSSYRVGGGDAALTAANGSLWLLSPGYDHVTQYALVSQHRIGAPVGVGSEAKQIAADDQAVWIGEESDTITRIGLQELALNERASGQIFAKSNDTAGVPSRLFLVLDLLVFGGLIVMLILLWQNKSNGAFPPYFTPSRLVIYALHLELYEAIASGTTKTRVRKRQSKLDGRGKVPPVVLGGSDTTTIGDYPLSKHVRDNIARWRMKDILYLGANFVPDFSHRGLRRKPADDPGETILRRHWQRIADAGSLCLIAQGDWFVMEDDDHHLSFILDYVVDRIAGDHRQIPRPPGTHLTMRVKKSHMKPIGLERCQPGQRIRMDVICAALPCNPDEMPTMDLVVAWLPVKTVREISQIGNYVLSLRARLRPSRDQEQT